MDEAETLRTIAEIGIALAGFTGVVAVLGRRSRGDWSPLESLRLSILLATSLAAVFLSFVPILMLRGVASVEAAWRASNGVCGVVFLIGMIGGFARWRASSYTFETTSVPVGWLLLGIMTPLGMLIGFAQVMIALGFHLLDAFLIYALCLLYLLSLSAMNFVFLLLPDKSPR